ncbi:MAG TPA: cysteine desulfurase NifS [Candidatus Dojkabacteria bacterium]|nr:cysteine desulfurase NifS [Candidatus Dojkabacteria bacterium]HQF36355.1 cysteine desulfurase NifS [Candidatus Dojkabacteria bacterium]
MQRTIYVDNSATTSVDSRVIAEMLPFFEQGYGNASTIYTIGQNSKMAIEKARGQVAFALGCLPEEIFFTSGGTESDNWAIIGTVDANTTKGKHIITSAIEHHAVLDTCKYLQKKGYEITYLPVDKDGLVSVDDLKKAIRKDTILISIMFANNEIGTIQPIEKIGEIARQNGIPFHTDAVQAVGNIPIDLSKLPVDMLSLSAHKFRGPKGVGVLYVKKGIKLEPFMHGGGQERKKRAGTENVPGIVGLGKAIELACKDIDAKSKKLIALRERLITGIMKNIEDVRINGHREQRLPGNANFSFAKVEGESILLLLDSKGICASSGSACTSGSLDPSHVLLAIGLSHEVAHGSVRFTLSDRNTEDDVDYIIEVMPEIIKKLREMSPLK